MERSDGTDSTDVSVLGEFELSVNGRQIDLAQRERRLVALLTLQGQCARDFLSGTLWPETTQDRAAASLRAAAYRIRRAAPALLRLRRCAIGFGDGIRTDLEPLRECLESATSPGGFVDPQAAQRVLSGGDLLAGWREDWILHERERLRHRRLRALAVLAEQCLADEDPRTALAATRAAEAIEPLRERTHLLGVRAMRMLGRHGEAMAHHRRFLSRLQRELGIRPSEKFIRLLAAG